MQAPWQRHASKDSWTVAAGDSLVSVRAAVTAGDRRLDQITLATFRLLDDDENDDTTIGDAISALLHSNSL